MSNLEISYSECQRNLVVKLAGAADMSQANLLRNQLETLVLGGKRNLILDLEDLEFICSLGLGAMIHLHTLCRKLGGNLGILNPQPQVRKVFKTTCLDQLFLIGNNQEELERKKQDRQGENL